MLNFPRNFTMKMKITASELRQKWLNFWKKYDHAIIPSASVIPDNDPTALFHNSGMHPLVPYLMGEKHPAGKRLANVQKCIRTGDIDEVGDATHLTFFEMLGNWSLGDYFKDEQITWSWEFLTKELGLPAEKLAVSVFAGDKDAPRDEETAQKWIEMGVPPQKIAYLGKKDNWWAKGEIGPCGTDTEMFYWTGDEKAPENFQDTHQDPRWVEIWNDVFMTFNREKDGSLSELPQRNVDTGMGLERTIVVLNGLKSVYETDVFREILKKIAEIAQKPEIIENPTAQTKIGNSARIIADHLRTAVILLADKIVPSNLDQGYILRRLIRRAIRHGRKLGIQKKFAGDVAEEVIKSLQDHYPELLKNKDFILKELEIEEKQFAKTLEQGEREFLKLAEKIREFSNKKEISGKKAFWLYETFGFPVEMTEELAFEQGLTVDLDGFKKAEKKHQEKSRAGAEKKFKGGLGDNSIETTRLHTATHLLHAGLRKVLGDHVEQRGSNITPERLRFDFSHPEKLTEEQKKAVEDYVNSAIRSDIAVSCEETTVEDAKNRGAIGLFGDKYGEKVKMYTIGEFSREICGGPHVEKTGDMGTFKIKKEQASSRGVRRIKAVLIPENNK